MKVQNRSCRSERWFWIESDRNRSSSDFPPVDASLEKVRCKNIAGVEGEGFLFYRIKNMKFTHIKDFSHF